MSREPATCPFLHGWANSPVNPSFSSFPSLYVFKLQRIHSWAGEVPEVSHLAVCVLLFLSLLWGFLMPRVSSTQRFPASRSPASPYGHRELSDSEEHRVPAAESRSPFPCRCSRNFKMRLVMYLLLWICHFGVHLMQLLIIFLKKCLLNNMHAKKM